MNFEKIGRKIKLIKLQKAVDKNFKPLIFFALASSIIITFSGVALINTMSLFEDSFILLLLSIFLASFVAALPIYALFTLKDKVDLIWQKEKSSLNLIEKRLK